jgi:hypothetical protein
MLRSGAAVLVLEVAAALPPILLAIVQALAGRVFLVLVVVVELVELSSDRGGSGGGPNVDCISSATANGLLVD